MSYFEDYDASGLVSLSLRIVDIVNDTMLLAQSTPDEYDIGITFGEIWNDNQEFFSGLLQDHSIIQQSIILNDFPLIAAEDTLGFTIDTEWIEVEKSEMGWAYIDDLTVKLTSKNLGIKTVYHKDGQYICVGAQICGYIKDPHSELIVLPMVLLHPGWEGPPYTTSLSMIACNPTKGFSTNTH